MNSPQSCALIQTGEPEQVLCTVTGNNLLSDTIMKQHSV